MAQGNVKRHCETTDCRDLCKVHKLKKEGCDKFDSVSPGSGSSVEADTKSHRASTEVRVSTPMLSTSGAAPICTRFGAYVARSNKRQLTHGHDARLPVDMMWRLTHNTCPRLSRRPLPKKAGPPHRSSCRSRWWSLAALIESHVSLDVVCHDTPVQLPTRIVYQTRI